MKKLLLLLCLTTFFMQPSDAWSWRNCDNDEKAIKKLLSMHVKYANRTDLDKFIKTYDSKYINTDGFNLDIYSDLVKGIWERFDNIEYAIVIKDIEVSENKATVELVEKSYAEIPLNDAYDGELKSESNAIYYLEKINGSWKIIADKVLDETTSMLYGQAKDLDIKLTTPLNIEPNKEYTATLEFVPPKETLAIASISSDIVEYPQKPTKEVFRVLPEDNILERIFTSNSQDANEYVVASIGLTKTAVCNLDVKLSLTGFGYHIKRVNVVNKNGENDVKN